MQVCAESAGQGRGRRLLAQLKSVCNRAYNAALCVQNQTAIAPEAASQKALDYKHDNVMYRM